jgi:hypothetical protein
MDGTARLPNLERRVDSLLGAAESRVTSRERRESRDRRRMTWRTFVQGGLTPRRRGGRRDGEHDELVDWHEPHLLFLALTILLLSVADAFLTLTLLTLGAAEANPFLGFILDEHPKLFALVKMAFTGGGVLVLVAVARARVFSVIRVSTIMHWLLLAYAALIFYEWSLLNTHL